jgi:aminoglycoside phosphotransferase (APT) family kinase protein
MTATATASESGEVELHHDLPAGIVEWVASLGPGTVTRLERHVARREAWVVDVRRADGSVLEGFLRLEREPEADNPWSLEKETRIVEALASTVVPVPVVYGWNDDLHAALFERIPGRADLPAMDEATQHAVMTHFMEVVGDMHTLDLDTLTLPPMPMPTTALECALGEVDLILDKWSGFLETYSDPLITFGVDWLRRNAPTSIARVSLVQGDTGPVNFMFDGDRVNAVIDWEWGHFGDPMEDLGNICVREFWNPSGGLLGLFDHYEKSSGIPVDLDAVRYYRVQQNVRGMIPIHAVTMHAHPREPVAWYLAYRYVGDRSTCEALAEAMGLDVSIPSPLEDPGPADVLADAAKYALANDVAAAVTDPFVLSRLNDARILVDCMDRVRRFGPILEVVELDELELLLGVRPDSVATGMQTLTGAIAAHSLPDEAIVAYLLRRSVRLEQLYAPAVALYPERRWSPLE